ncbi:Hint domain-containing protein [Nioella aestuarii]|uniref:Hint domain-containing protein n=1 Tax=Nioella aestuarii TaxID=1662864 RepID=UPI003D7FFC21
MSGEIVNPSSVDGVVDGTPGDDNINLAYTGDPEGDMIDAGDAILDGAAPDDDVLLAGEGNDTVHAGVGDDIIWGNDGDDYLDGEDGDDTIKGEGGNDTLIGGDGNDHLIGGDGNASVDGGNGDDFIDTRLDGNLSMPDRGYPGLFPGDPVPTDAMDTIDGGAGNDTIFAGDDADSITGGSGHDQIDGGFDDDTIDAGEGDDLIVGGEGSDTILGQSGDDTIYGGLGPGFPDELNITDDGSDGNPIGPDAVTDNGRDYIEAGDGNDVVYGQDDDDTIYGGAGNDTLDGGIDEDEIYGGADRDVILGGNAGDYVDGGGTGDDYDTLDLRGSGPLRVVLDADNPENGTVTFYDGNGYAPSNVTGTMRFEEIENVVPCFTPGSRIATPRGEVAVEALQPGDKIITRDNGIQEIRWIGSRMLNHAELRRAPNLRPVLIKAGALGNGLPERDMLVSPQHRMLVGNDRTQLYFEESEVLVAAKHLVDHKGIRYMDTLRTTYIHFMFDQHEVVLADGAWTESFQPGDQTLGGMGKDQRDEIYTLFPELQQPAGIDSYAAARKVLKGHEARLIVR